LKISFGIYQKTNIMNIKDVAKLMNTFAEVYPDCEVTFANNKVKATVIQFDIKSNSINIR